MSIDGVDCTRLERTSSAGNGFSVGGPDAVGSQLRPRSSFSTIDAPTALRTKLPTISGGPAPLGMAASVAGTTVVTRAAAAPKKPSAAGRRGERAGETRPGSNAAALRGRTT